MSETKVEQEEQSQQTFKTISLPLVFSCQLKLYYHIITEQKRKQMGSSPSTSVSEDGESHHEREIIKPANVKDSLKLLKSKGKHIEEQVNPQRELDKASSTNEFLAEVPHKDARAAPKTNRIYHEAAKVDYEIDARKHLPQYKKPVQNEQRDESQHSDHYEAHPRNEQHPQPRQRASQLRKSQNTNEEDLPHVPDRAQMRHPHQNHQETEDYVHNSSIINKTHKKDIHEPKIDYEEYTPYVIRHRAEEEIIHEARHSRQQKDREEDYHNKAISGRRKDDSRMEDHQREEKINIYKKANHLPEEQEPQPKVQPSTFRRHRRLDHHEEENEKHVNPNNHGDEQHQRNFKKNKKVSQQEQQRLKQLYQQNENRSIADINKENQFEVNQYEQNDGKLITCRQGCGRKFNPNSIKKHEVVCKKVFQRKRKEFDAVQHRLVSKEQVKLMKKGEQVEKKLEIDRKKQKIPKWKAQSIALRAHVKLGMDQNYQLTKEEEEMLSQERHIDVVDCPYCGRHFNKNAAKAHIPFCKTQAEKQAEKERFQKHPFASKHHN